MSELQPAPIEGSENGLGKTPQNYALTGDNYNALIHQRDQLEIQLFNSETERNALFEEVISFLLDLPIAWRIWHLNNVLCSRVPERVMIEIRRELKIPQESVES